MMNKRFNQGMLAWLCALLMLVLPVGAAAQEAADDPVAVRVGEFTYTQSQLQGSLDSMLELSQMLRGDAPSEEEKQARLQATVDSFVGLGVIENKLSEAGKNDFTDAELEDINQTARSKYEELWQVLYQQMQKSDSSVTEAAVTAQLEGMGYTFEARASSRVETGITGNLLSCSKRVKDPLEVPEVRGD